MPSVLSPQQAAFDAAVKSWCDFDYPGIADLEELRTQNPSLSAWVDQLVELRQAFNAALSVEGQHITDHAPHSPFYFDYLDSHRSNARAFRDENHSFIGVTLPLVRGVAAMSTSVSASDAVVTRIGLPMTTDREVLKGVLSWLLLGYVITHEYTHHVHGHLDGRFEPLEEISAGSLKGTLAQQARELDADGYAAYFTLAFWLDSPDGRNAISHLLGIQDLPPESHDAISFSCFLVAQAAFTFLREPELLDRDKAYRRTHPPQPVRLQVMSRFARKWSTEFRPTLYRWMTQARYQLMMDAVSAVIWTGKHAVGWRAQMEFLKSDDGTAYVNALLAELDSFRGTLRTGNEATGTSDAIEADRFIGVTD